MTVDLTTMIYWTLAILAVVALVDFLLIKPYQEDLNLKLLKREFRIKRKVDIPRDNSQGIIVVANDQNYIKAILLITTIRRMGCRSPIMVCYQNLNDQYFHSLNVKLMHIDEKFHNSQARMFALLHCPYQKTLLLEPDLLFLSNPDYLFQNTLFNQTGALFWKDQYVSSIWDKKITSWVKKLIPYRKGDNTILDKTTGSYQSQDILLIDKAQHAETLGKLSTFIDNWDIINKPLINDKECYWIAAELSHNQYHFVDSRPGLVGHPKANKISGYVLYPGPDGELLCWKGDNDTMDFTHYSFNDESKELDESTCKLLNEYSHILHNIKENIEQY